jgi:DNA modification methylase
MISPSMVQSIELWLIEKLIPWARNPRTHSEGQIAQIAASIAEFGFNNPILVDTKAGIIAGHGRLLAARKLGLKEVPVIVLDHLTEAQKRAYIIADNQLALNAGWDEDLLRQELVGLQNEDFNLDLIGFDDEDLARLLAEQEAAQGLTDEDAVPELPETPTSVLGDLWILGSHRLMVGDATNALDIDKLCGGTLSDLIFTDPPYGVAIASRVGTVAISSAEARSSGTKQIQNDDMSVPELTQFLRLAFTNIVAVTRKGACWYVCAPHGPMGLAFSITLNELGVWRNSIVWVKDSLVMSRMDYHYRHEPIYYGWTPGAAHNAVPTRNQDTVWEFARPKRSLEHPTMKPVELIEKAVLNSSNAGDIVYDCFGGAGST